MACFSVWDIGACGCTCACTINGTVAGCGGRALQGVTVTAYDSTSGGTVLGTATTSSTGTYSIAVSGATSGNSIVVAASQARFVTGSVTLTYTSGTPGSTHWSCTKTSTTVNIALSPATGYACYSGCAYPVSTTLYYTNSYFGSITLTYSGGFWTGNISYSYGVCTQFGCTEGSATLTMHVTNGVINSISGASGTDCGGLNSCASSAGPSSTTLASCYIPGVSAFSLTGSKGSSSCDSGNCADFLFCCAYPGTYPAITIAVTE